MKLRKILSSVIAGALAVSAMTFSASAEAVTILDFEDGSFAGITMKTDDGGDKSELSVVDYNGSKQLRVAIQKPDRIPKVFFNIGELIGLDNMDKLAGFKLDLTVQSTLVLDDWTDPENIVYEIPSWQGGGCGAQDGAGGALPWTELGGWTAEEYEGYSKTITLEYSLGGKTFTNGTEGSHILLMKWAAANNPVDMYIDNVVFLDADGNAMEFYPAADAATEEEAPAEDEATEEAPAEEEVEEEAPAEEEAEEEEAPAEEEVEEEEAPAEEEAEIEEDAEEEVEEEEAPVEEEEEAPVEEEEEAPVEEEAPAAGDVAGETDSSKGSPDTGVEDVAVVAGLAIVAAGAVLVSKKRK